MPLCPTKHDVAAGATSTPAARSSAQRARGGGDSYSFNYSFATGVTKAELGPLLALNQRQTLAQLADICGDGPLLPDSIGLLLRLAGDVVALHTKLLAAADTDF